MRRRHRAALAVGSLLSLAALLAPLSQLPQERLSLHMLEEMLVLAVVIPLLAYGVSPLLAGRAASRIHPVAGIVALNVVLFGSQLPAVVDLASKDPGFREAMQAVFMMGAFLFWWPVVRRDGLSPMAKIGYLMVAGVPPTILGLAFILSPVVIYPFYAAAPRVTPLSPLDDQLVAGLVMFGLGNLIYFAAIWIIFFRLDDKAATAGERPVVEIETPVTMV